MQFSIILFLSVVFIVTTTVCVNSKHLQDSTFRSGLQKNRDLKDLQGKTTWVHQQNHKQSSVKSKISLKKNFVSTTTPRYRWSILRTTKKAERVQFIENYIESNTQATMYARLIAPRKFNRCSVGFVRNAMNICVRQFAASHWV